MTRDPNLEGGHLFQWEDMSPSGRRVASDNIRAVGESIPERVAGQLERAKSSSSQKAAKEVKSLAAIQPHVRREPVSVQRAANHRQRAYQDALARKQAEGNPDNTIPDGAGWYFEHHARIAQSADRHGFPQSHALTGSAVMSPQNSPENERAAVNAIMDTLSNHQVKVTPEVHAHLASKGIDVSHHLGKTVPMDALPSGAVGWLSDKSFAPRVQTSADLRSVSRGGAKDQNITRSERILTGEDPAGPAAHVNKKGVVSSTKVGSYDHVTQEAVPGSATHVEYMGRVQQGAMVDAGQISPDQQALDLYGFRAQEERGELPKDHLLSTESHTVEDTWQTAITFNQPKELTGEKDKTSVFKAGGSGEQYPPTGLKIRRGEKVDAKGEVKQNQILEKAHPDPRVEDSMVLHAFNNKATREAAKKEGRRTGTAPPPTAVQAVGWTEVRKQAGKSRDQSATSEANKQLTAAEYKDEVDLHHDRLGMSVPPSVREQPAPAPSKFERENPGHIRGQGSLFSMEDRAGRVRSHLPGAGVAPLDRPVEGPDLTPSQMEADLRKHEAIYRSRQRGGR